jgi:hypothetical protein
VASILTEGAGYFILFGVGMLMAFVVPLLVKAETKCLEQGKLQNGFLLRVGI